MGKLFCEIEDELLSLKNAPQDVGVIARFRSHYKIPLLLTYFFVFFGL